MYKLLVVDDEISIIEGLSRFDWNSLGIELSGAFKNGLAALQWLEKNPVDIILTDIKMPIMDGLELANLVRKNYPFTYVVILSGYNDFELARSSIKSGVSDYLLKPVQKEDLIEIFNKLTKSISQSKQQQMKMNALEKKARFAIKYLKQDFLKKLMTSRLSSEEIEEGCTYGELSFESSIYTVCIFRLDVLAQKPSFYSSEDWDLILFAFDNILSEVCEELDLGYHWVNPETGDCYIILTNEEIQSSSENIADKMRQLKNSLYSIDGLIRSTISCAIGSCCHNADEISISSLDAYTLLDNSQTRDAIIPYNEAVKKTMSNGGMSELPNSQLLAPLDINVDISSKKHILKKAIDFINSNYMQSITLNSVAEHAFINPAYLSIIFKEVTGVNFIHYLTNLRIEEAKRLLQDSSFKVKDVGEAVGYENPRYFSKIFKKYTSVTPYEFRSCVMEGTKC